MRLSKPEISTDGLIRRARQDQDVLAVIIFGSRSRGDEGPASDVDICLVMQPKDYSKLELSRKRLEYLKHFANAKLDIQIYQQLPLYIKKRILQDGEVIFCRDEDILYELAFRTIQEFEDFKRIYYSYLEEVTNG